MHIGDVPSLPATSPAVPMAAVPSMPATSSEVPVGAVGGAADTDEDDVGPPVMPPLDSGIFRAGDPQDIKSLIEELKRAARAQTEAYRAMAAYYRSKIYK